MAKLGISTGVNPNDGLGDTLLTGAIKINSNFNEIYNTIGDGVNITNSIGYAVTAGIATFAGISSQVSSTININTTGIITASRIVAGGPSTFTSNLSVGGDLRISGILTVGDSSVVIDGNDNIINVGSGVTIEGNSGIIRAVEFYADGVQVGVITAESIIYEGTVLENVWTSNATGIHTLSNVGVGTTNSSSKLTINGDVVVSGVTTTNSLSIGSTQVISSSRQLQNILSLDSITTETIETAIANAPNNFTDLNITGITTLSRTTISELNVSGVTTSSGGFVGNLQGNVTGTATTANNATNLDNQTSSYYLDYDNFTNTPTNLSEFSNDVGFATETYVNNLVAISTFSGNYNDLTNTPTNLSEFSNDVGFATETYVDLAVANLVNSAPETLDTLNELAAALGDDPNFATTITNELGNKANLSGANFTGIVTATSFIGDGSNLTGISSFSGDYNDLINTPTNISNFNNDVGFITSFTDTNYWLQTTVGIHTLSNVGIGTTNPTSALTVNGNALISGVVTATTFVGNFSGSITDATNLTGGYANASQLNVSGIATISQGRIQADASSNLRFGNIAAGSGSGRNIAIGDQVLVSLSGGQGRNIGIGELSYYDTTTGQYNIGIGERAGQKVSTGSYNVVLGAYDGNSGGLDIRTSSRNVVIADGEGNIRQYINSSGNVGIKTTVVTEALTVAGIVSATSFYGTLNAGQLTGSLPAIDGSALIGVVGSGSGVIIEDDATPVGTAGTINFGTNLNVSFAGGTATVSGTGLATYANVAGIATYATNAGFATVSNTSNYALLAGVSTTSGTAGYATTAGISSAVSGTININTTGIITASSFSGSGSSLTNLPAGQLTGTLPAIDGSALLNVTATGTGIVVDDDNVNVGSAVTVNFGTGLDVTFSAGIATITASGGSLQSRTTVSGVTTSIANNGIGNTNITGFKSYALMRVGLSTAGWLRIYTDSASRDADVFRSVGEDPAAGSGVIAEVVTTGISTTQIISPFVMGGNLDNPADTTIYASIKNLSGSTQSITANLTILQLEA
jgi:hypothetical protein